MLVKSFASVFTRESALTDDCHLDTVVTEQIHPLIINDSDVKRELLALNTSKAAGPDGIHPRIVRTLAENDNFVSAVANLYRTVSTTGQLPQAWKRAILLLPCIRREHLVMLAIIDQFH